MEFNLKPLTTPTEFDYEKAKNTLIKYFFELFDSQKFPPTEDVEAIHKLAIANKSFDLVSIALSLLGLVYQKSGKQNYYKTLLTLGDAKFLAGSVNSKLALKINLWAQGYIEYYERDYENALETLKLAQMTQCGCSPEVNERIEITKHKVKLHLEKEQILSAPSFSPKSTSDDPLLALLKVGRTIAIETNIDELLKTVAHEIRMALNADRCTVFLLDEEKNELWSKVALGMDLKEIRFPANLGIAGHVASTGATVNISDAYSDERFNKEIDAQTGYKTTNILCMPIMNMAHQIVGVFQVLNKKNGNFTQKDEDVLLAIGSSASIALDNAALFDKQQKLIAEQKELFAGFIDTLAASIDARDKITAGHSQRVTRYVELICDALNLPKHEIEIIRQASLLHDIGKLGIRDSVLQKDGKLTDEEYGHIKEHAQVTHTILSKVYSSEGFKEVAEIASSHHEKWDGSGYFRGAAGENIPLGGRILSVCDVFDAITSTRHYRSRMKIEDAIRVLIENSNKHFDKWLVDVFLGISTDKIIKVFLTDSELSLCDADKAILSRYRLQDIFTLRTLDSEITIAQDEARFMETFLRYYEERI